MALSVYTVYYFQVFYSQCYSYYLVIWMLVACSKTEMCINMKVLNGKQATKLEQEKKMTYRVPRIGVVFEARNLVTLL